MQNISIVHYMPGRVRLKISSAKGNENLCREIMEMAQLMPGIQAVKANPITGSVLVHYDSNAIEHEHLLEALSELNEFIPSVSVDVDTKGIRADLQNEEEDSEEALPDVMMLQEESGKDADMAYGAINLNILMPILIATGVYFWA